MRLRMFSTWTGLTLRCTVTVGWSLIALTLAHAQENNGKAPEPSIASRVVILPKQSADSKPAKPHRLGEKEQSSEVQKLVREFNAARESYLERQKEIALQLRETSKESRDALREQNKEMLRQLKEQQRLFRQEARERASDLKREVHQDFGRVIDSGVNEGRGR